MTAEENVRAQFAALLEEGSLRRSACSGSFLKALRPLLDSGVVAEERSGAGRRLAVRDAVAARSFFSQRYPDAALFTGASSRVVGVARFRDTKVLAPDEPQLVCVRAWPANVLFRDGQPVEAAAATAEHGVFAFVLGDQSRYSLRGACALVENPAVLTCIERLNLPIGLASLIATQRLLRIPLHPTRRPIDYLGATLMLGGLEPWNLALGVIFDVYSF